MTVLPGSSFKRLTLFPSGLPQPFLARLPRIYPVVDGELGLQVWAPGRGRCGLFVCSDSSKFSPRSPPPPQLAEARPSPHCGGVCWHDCRVCTRDCKGEEMSTHPLTNPSGPSLVFVVFKDWLDVFSPLGPSGNCISLFLLFCLSFVLSFWVGFLTLIPITLGTQTLLNTILVCFFVGCYSSPVSRRCLTGFKFGPPAFRICLGVGLTVFLSFFCSLDGFFGSNSSLRARPVPRGPAFSLACILPLLIGFYVQSV